MDQDKENVFSGQETGPAPEDTYTAPNNPYAAPGSAYAASGAWAAPQPNGSTRRAGIRKAFALEKRDVVFAAVAAALTLFGVIAGVWGGFRAGFAAAFLLLFIWISAYLIKTGKPTFFGVVCGALSLGLLPGFVLTSNEAVRLLSVFGAGVLSVLWFSTLSGRRIPHGDLGLIPAAGLPLLDSIGNTGKTLRGLFTGSKRRKGSFKALLGVLCAVPVLCVVVPLLTKSDAAFEGMLQNVAADLGRIAAQIAVAVLLLPLILSFAVSLKKEQKDTPDVKEGKGLDTVFITAFLAVLSVAYVVYLVSQLAYFFDAFKGMLPADYTFSYAEYARRGFFELCGVAAVNLAVILGMLLFARKTEGRLPGVLKAFGTFLSLFTLLLIGTALAKMALYIREFGFTVLRLGVSAFMVFMAAVFLAALLRLYFRKVRVLQVSAVAAALVLIVLGVGNINGFVAEYNYNAYVTGQLKQIDASYLGDLGPEGVPYLVKLMEDENEYPQVRRKAATAFFRVCCDSLYQNEWDTEKTYEINGKTYTDYGYTFDSLPVRKAARPSQFSLPLSRAYAAADAFLADHPDFLEKEGMLYCLYDTSAYGYFDNVNALPAPPYDWDAD